MAVAADTLRGEIPRIAAVIGINIDTCGDVNGGH